MKNIISMKLKFKQSANQKALVENTKKALELFAKLELQPIVTKGEFGTKIELSLSINVKGKSDTISPTLSFIITDKEWPVSLLQTKTAHASAQLPDLSPNPEDQVGNLDEANYYRIDQIPQLIEKQVTGCVIDQIVSIKQFLTCDNEPKDGEKIFKPFFRTYYQLETPKPVSK